jgi:hypothetical protein
VTLRKILPDRVSRVYDSSRDGKRVLILAYSDVKPPAYYLLDITAGSLTQLASSNPQLDKATLAPTKSVVIPARAAPGETAGSPAADVKIRAISRFPWADPGISPPSCFRWRPPWTSGITALVQLIASRSSRCNSTSQFDELRRRPLRAGWQVGARSCDDITAARLVGRHRRRSACASSACYGGYAALLGVKEPTCTVRGQHCRCLDLSQLKVQGACSTAGSSSPRVHRCRQAALKKCRYYSWTG